jgi:hypothetical protein
MYVVLALLGVSGTFVVLLCTGRYGAGTTPDSSAYISSARSLLAGKGYLLPEGKPCTRFPPLFPTLIALVAIPGEDALTAARVLNALAFGGTIFLSRRLFLMCTPSAAFAVVGTLSVLLSGDLLDVSSMIWSEPVFVLLTVLFLLLMTRFLRTRSTASLVLVSVVAAMAWLDRYAGVPVIVAGCILVALGPSGVSLLRRLSYVLCFGLISAGPMAVWLWRNLVVIGKTGAPPWEPWSVQRLDRAVTAPLNVVAEWFVPGSGSLPSPETIHGHTTYFLKWFGPGSESSPLRVIGVAVVVLLAVVAVRSAWRRRADSSTTAVTPIGPATVFLLTYLGFLAVVSIRSSGDLFTHRYLAPAYVPMALLVIAGMEKACGFLGGLFDRSEGGKSLALWLCILWLLYPLDNTRGHFRYCRRYGVCGTGTPECQRSPLMEWLRNHPLQGRLYSNVPHAVYLLTGAEVDTTPHHYWDASEFARREFVSQPSYVVWLHKASWDWLYDLRELLSRYQMREVAAFPDGCVYQYLGEGGPPVSGVYRFWSSKKNRHCYTIQKGERDRLIRQSGGTWTYEGPAFYAFPPDSTRPPDVRPVYRLWSAGSQAHFYTMDEGERDRLLELPAGVWTCEGVAFYAWPQAGVKDVVPVYRFWSQRLGCHLYVGRESEKTGLVTELSQAWAYEGIAWYAYGPETF